MSHPVVAARPIIRPAARTIALAALLLAVIGAGIGLPTSFGGVPSDPGTSSATSGSPGREQDPVAPDWSAPHVPGQLLIKLSPGLRTPARASLAAASMQLVDTIPQLGLAVVETAPGADLAVAAADLAENPDVEWAEPNYTFTLDLTPNDPYYTSQQTRLPLGYPLGLLQMPDAWDYTTGRPEVVIAVLDTGVDMAHPDLSAGIWTNPDEIADNDSDDDKNGFVDDIHGWDFAGDDNEPTDDHGHGTHVSGIAAARINNGVGIAGMAGQATIMPVDVFGGGIGTYDSLIRAIIYATDNGARVINMSLGATSYSRGEEAAVDYAWSHGVVLVASAGNTGTNTYHYPAAHPHVIAVAGTNTSDGWAGYTYGDFVDVAAPGVSVWSTYRGGSYAGLSGTSMAAPHVSGLAALILSLNPDLTPDQVRDRIEQNADDRGDPGWDPKLGHGRINAARTLAEVTPNPNPTPSPTPGPPLEIWPDGCQELIPDGDFESGFGGWQAGGSVSITDTLAYSGTRSAAFPGVPNSRGVLTRTLELPTFPMTGTLWFAYRIYTTDPGKGSLPSFPYDDWLTAEFRSPDGQLIQSLLRTGNSADTVGSGLPWDEYLYRMQSVDFAAFRIADPMVLVLEASNDGDPLPTDFWVDAVRFCVAGVDKPSWPDLVALALEETNEDCSGSEECACDSGSGVRLTVANQGQADASNFYVQIATQGGYNQWRVASLPAGESREFTWCGGPGIFPYTGTVDEQNMVVESDETNNQISKDFRHGIFLPLIIR